MSNVIEIERAIEKLSAEELVALRAWFKERDASMWDSRIETDIAAGKLDVLGEQALADLLEGRCTDL